MAESRSSDIFILHPVIAIVGRVMFTLIFFLSGVTHFTGVQDYAALMPQAIPFREFWVVISGVVELIGALMVVSNRYARLGAWLIAIFLVPVTVTVHGVAMVTAADPRMQQMQLSFFLKGITMTGAALLITQLGVVAPADKS